MKRRNAELEREAADNEYEAKQDQRINATATTDDQRDFAHL